MTSRIHIIGGPGSGKSYLAHKLSEALDIPHYDLDDIFWDNLSDTYGNRAHPEIRDKILQQILQYPKWIIEGVYYQWVGESFRLAEIIVVLRPLVYIRDLRIVKRFIKRKLRQIKGKRETIKDFIELLRWNHGYDSDNLLGALIALEPYQDKILDCQSADKTLRFIIHKAKA